MGMTTTSRLGTLGVALCMIAVGASAQTASAPAAPAASTSSKLAHADSAFIKDAAEAGNFEVEESQLALSRTSNAQVKSFAQQMVDDHTKAGQELAGLAQSKGVKVSDKPSMAQRAKIDLLKTHKDGFDKNYAESQANAHDSVVKMFRKEASEGKDADVKAWAAKTLPTLEHHQQMAQELKTATAGK